MLVQSEQNAVVSHCCKKIVLETINMMTAYSHKTKKEIIMTQQLFLISDVSRMLGVPAHRIAYQYMTRKLPEPALKLGNRRVFTLTEIHKVAKALNRPVVETEAK
jgi:hypothetical protein